MLVEIIGVGFFDRSHKQTGRAPNDLEIHPILAINFNPGVGPQPISGPTPPQPVTTQPSAGAVQWEYEVITSTNETDLAQQANALGAQGWEMVSVVFDSTRADKYVGYLKRKK